MAKSHPPVLLQTIIICGVLICCVDLSSLEIRSCKQALWREICNVGLILVYSGVNGFLFYSLSCFRRHEEVNQHIKEEKTMLAERWKVCAFFLTYNIITLHCVQKVMNQREYVALNPQKRDVVVEKNA